MKIPKLFFAIIMIILAISPKAFGETAKVLSESMDTIASVAVIDSIKTDSAATPATADSIFNSLKWYDQLLENGFRIHDPRINYPKFMQFCLKVYDWGDKTFNSYDPDYVVGVGKNWKVMTKSYNWMTSYMMFFHDDRTLHMRSNIYNDLGAYVCFMAVSLGYTAKLDNLIGHGRKTRENLSFSFTTSRFHAALNYWKTIGDMKITHLGDYNFGNHFAYDFDAVKMRSFSGEAYYFFNHLKYSQAAAYCFSKYQLKGAGSWMVGLAFNHQTLDMDFSQLPKEMLEYLPSLADKYRFHFNDYDLMCGYGHNWVPHPKRWVINLTALPSIGYRYSYADSSDGKRNLFSSNLRVLFSCVYNNKALFASIIGRFDGHLYFNNRYTLFDSVESLSLIVGARF